MIQVATQGGLGLPRTKLSPSESTIFFRSVWASNLLYTVSITSAKAAVLLLYLRIFTVRRFRIAIYLVGTLCLLWFVAAFFIFLFQCQPVNKGWVPNTPGACLDLRNVYYGTSASNSILDIIVTVMPIRVIWKLKLARKQRVVLTLIMCLGLMYATSNPTLYRRLVPTFTSRRSIFASIGRIYSVPELMVADLPATIDMPIMYAVIEPAFAIIAACLPTYRPIFSWLGTTVRSSLGSSRGSSNSRAKLHWGSGGSSSSDRSGGEASIRSPASDQFRFPHPPRRTPTTMLESVEERWEWEDKLPPPAVPPKDEPAIDLEMPPDMAASPLRATSPALPRLHIVTTPGLVSPLNKHITHIMR